MVCHLEYGVQHCMFVCTGVVNLDTLTTCHLAWIGGKLHYRHLDFLNATFMSMCGGVSKAQKGLHLNKDIFMGMNAFSHGGQIKHLEYYQCSKGHDLGFGTGMGEQMLSWEYYYLGSQLSIDHFLMFYYAHPVSRLTIFLSSCQSTLS